MSIYEWRFSEHQERGCVQYSKKDKGMADFSVAVLRRVSSDMSSFSDGRDIPEDVLDSLAL